MNGCIRYRVRKSAVFGSWFSPLLCSGKVSFVSPAVPCCVLKALPPISRSVGVTDAYHHVRFFFMWVLGIEFVSLTQQALSLTKPSSQLSASFYFILLFETELHVVQVAFLFTM